MPVPAIAAAAAALALKELAKEGGGAAGRGLVGAAGRGFCEVHAKNPNVVGRLGKLASDFANGACAPYYNENGIAPPVPTASPFTGGQCPVLYRINVKFYYDPVGWYTTQVSGYGPIGGIDVGPGAPGYVFFSVRGHDFDGNPILIGVGATQPEYASMCQILSVERDDGQLDDCGDLQNQFDPSPDSRDFPEYGEPFNGQDSDDRDTPIIVFAPKFNPDIGLSIPINIDGTPGDLGSPPPPSGKPEDNKPLQNGPTQEPQPEDNGKVCFPELDGFQCVGVQWFLGVPGSLGVIPSSATFVPIYPRVIGNIRLLLGACDSILGFVEDQIQIRTAKGCLFRSVGGTKVSGAIINTLPGINSYLTPLYVEVEED